MFITDDFNDGELFRHGLLSAAMYVLGIHPDGDYFKVALLSGSRSMIRIIFLQEFKKDILDLNQLKRKVLKETKCRPESVKVVSGLTPEEVFVKKLSFPFVQKRAIMRALPFQMEKLLPFSEEHVTTIPEVKKKKKESEVTLYTFFNETMQTHLQDIKTLGFEPDSVSTISKGLLRFKKFFIGEAGRVALLYFGWEKSYLVYVDKDEVQHSLVIEGGFRQLIDAARADYPKVENLDFPFLKGEIGKYFQRALESGEVKKILEKLQKGLFRAFEYIKKRCELEEIDVVHLGYSAILEEITSLMTEVSTKTVDVVPHLEFDREQLKAYAIEIGLALDCLESGRGALQFRVGEFVASKQVEKLRGLIKTFLGVSVVSSLMVFCIMTALFIKKKEGVKERADYIKILEKEGDSTKKEDFLREPFLVSECLQEVAHLAVLEMNYELLEGNQVRLELLVRASSKEEALSSFEQVIKKTKVPIKEKGLLWIKEKNGYQMVFVFKEPA